MGRLIDIDRLCNDLMERWNIADKKKEDLIRAVMADVVTPIVVSQPTVDAVEVVRCRECRWCNMGECEHKFGLLVSNDENYCSYGESGVDI